MAIDVERLRTTSVRLSDAVADPARWTTLLDEIVAAAGAMGGGLLPDTGSEGAVASASLKECLETYIREGWSEADRYSRKRAVELQLRGEVATDRDLISENHRSPFIHEFLPRFGGKWWAGVGFKSGSKFWSLTLHRSPRQEPFEENERTVLRQFSWRLSEVGSLSYLAGHASLSDVANAFDRIRKAVVAIDATGKVIRANAAAERLFDDDVRIAGGAPAARRSRRGGRIREGREQAPRRSRGQDATRSSHHRAAERRRSGAAQGSAGRRCGQVAFPSRARAPAAG